MDEWAQLHFRLQKWMVNSSGTEELGFVSGPVFPFFTVKLQLGVEIPRDQTRWLPVHTYPSISRGLPESRDQQAKENEPQAISSTASWKGWARAAQGTPQVSAPPRISAPRSILRSHRNGHAPATSGFSRKLAT